MIELDAEHDDDQPVRRRLAETWMGSKQATSKVQQAYVLM